MKTALLIATLSLTALVAGCAGANNEDSTDTTSTDDALSAAKLAGTYEDTGSDALIFYSSQFEQNHEFSATGGCRPNPSGPSCFAIMRMTGTWKFGKSGPELGDPAGAAQIQLTDSFGQKTNLFYTLSGNKLELSEIYDGKVSTFTKQ